MSHYRPSPDYCMISENHARQDFGACSNPAMLADYNWLRLAIFVYISEIVPFGE